MPIYEYQHPCTLEIIEVIQSMKDEHTYVDEAGVEWKRVFNVPNAAIDAEGSDKINPFSEADFIRATEKNGMTAGDMMDLSKKLSEKREKSGGLDPIKDKTVTSYEKKTGKPHPNKSK